MPREPLVYLDDIITACDRILAYTKTHDLESFREDQLTIDAVLRNLEIVGEAAKNVPAELQAKALEVDWKRVAGLRDVIAHQYFAVNLETVWDIVSNRIGSLRSAVSSLLSSIEGND